MRSGQRRALTDHWSPEGEEIGARKHYRRRDDSVLAKYAKEFPKIDLFRIDEVFGGWDKAQKTHFEDKGVFDEIYTPK